MYKQIIEKNVEKRKKSACFPDFCPINRGKSLILHRKRKINVL